MILVGAVLTWYKSYGTIQVRRVNQEDKTAMGRTEKRSTIEETPRAAILHGPVTVAYKKLGKEWHCTALNFDLVGTGSSKQMAFVELRDVVNCYLSDIVDAEGPVEFFNPSPAEEWNVAEKEQYHVVVVMTRVRQRVRKRLPPVLPAEIESLPQLRDYAGYAYSFDLVPA